MPEEPEVPDVPESPIIFNIWIASEVKIVEELLEVESFEISVIISPISVWKDLTLSDLSESRTICKSCLIFSV